MLTLPPAAAEKNLPVILRGIVTAAEPDWDGKFMVQDDSGGIFVTTTGRQPAVGDLIELRGTTSPGAFAPVIRRAEWRKLGTAPLPPGRQVTVERLMAGGEDSQRVEVTGLVRAVTLSATRKLQIDLALGAARIRVFPKLPPNLNPQALIAAKVRVRGTVTTSFNALLRQLTAVNLFVPLAEDFEVIEREAHPPFDREPVALAEVARYRPAASLGERVRVRGVVTLQRPGLDLFLQDATGGLHVETTQPVHLAAGTLVDAFGFLEVSGYQPVLRDAVLRPSSDPAVRVAARPVSFPELRDGLHPAEFVSLTGRLVARSVLPVRRERGAFAGVRILHTIQTPDLTFAAECEAPADSPAHAEVPLGSTVEVAGVAIYETGDDGRMRGFNLLLPGLTDLRVLEKPSWFTPERLVIGFCSVCVLLAGVAGWSLTVSKKNAMLGLLVADREKAQRELQQAHDQLEARVRERTEQLKVEMTERKAAEVEFRAVLTERTRLARELHDTLEQALTGIALQLDTAARLFAREPREAQGPLELARGFLRQSQLDLRRSIWDLRSRELQQFDLAEALRMAGGQITAGGTTAFELVTDGDRRRLPEVVEDNLLRIGQEALTNVVKHARATRVTVRLGYAPESVVLEITDNGTGIDPAGVGSVGGNQFGLRGMAERAKRLDGRLEFSSVPGEGTVVRAVIGLKAGADQPAWRDEEVTIL